MNSEFEPPSRVWSTLAVIGGVVVAAAMIAGLEMLQQSLPKTPSGLDPLDRQSVQVRRFRWQTLKDWACDQVLLAELCPSDRQP